MINSCYIELRALKCNMLLFAVCCCCCCHFWQSSFANHTKNTRTHTHTQSTVHQILCGVDDDSHNHDHDHEVKDDSGDEMTTTITTLAVFTHIANRLCAQIPNVIGFDGPFLNLTLFFGLTKFSKRKTDLHLILSFSHKNTRKWFTYTFVAATADFQLPQLDSIRCRIWWWWW